MGRIVIFIAALTVSQAPGCRRDEPEPVAAAKAAEPPAAEVEVEQSALIEADRISVSGRVTETGGERMVVKPAGGEPLAVRLDDATTISLNGAAAAAGTLMPGTEVRLLYRLDGAQLVAERLDGRR